MIEVLLLAMALAMDAFAVAIGLGAKSQKRSYQYLLRLAIYAALYFGILQGVMPIIGYLLGSALLGWLAAAAPWIGGIILIALGGKMLYEVFFTYTEEAVNKAFNLNNETMDTAINVTPDINILNKSIHHYTMLMLAIATSIDAMAAGFTLNLLALNAWLACLIIAIITAGFSFFGVYLGRRSGTWLEDKAEALGGIVLIMIGLKVMLLN